MSVLQAFKDVLATFEKKRTLSRLYVSSSEKRRSKQTIGLLPEAVLQRVLERKCCFAGYTCFRFGLSITNKMLGPEAHCELTRLRLQCTGIVIEVLVGYRKVHWP